MEACKLTVKTAEVHIRTKQIGQKPTQRPSRGKAKCKMQRKRKGNGEKEKEKNIYKGPQFII